MSTRDSPATTWRPRGVAATATPAPAASEPGPGGGSAAQGDTPAESKFAWPFLLVLLYFLVDFGRPQDWFSPIGALRPGMAVLGGGLISLLLRRQQIVLDTRGKLLIVFLCLMALGTPLATNRFWAYMATKDFALLLFGAVVPLACYVNTYARMRALVGWFVLLHIPLSLYCIQHGGKGIGSFLGDENDFCLALNMILPFAFFSLYLVRKTAHRFYLVAVLALFLFTITSTLSRGGFLGLLAVVIACWLASPRKVLSLAGLLTLTLTVTLFVPSTYWDEMNTIKTSTDEEDTGAQRLYFWGLAWQMFLDYPIVGVGPTNYQWNAHFYESDDQVSRGLNVWGKGCHSLYFTLLPEYGVVGTIVFVSLLVVNMRSNRRIRQTYRRLVMERAPPELVEQVYGLSIISRANGVALLGYLVTGAFLSVLYYPHFWLQIGFGMALSRILDKLLDAQRVSQTATGVTFGVTTRTAGMRHHPRPALHSA